MKKSEVRTLLKENMQLLNNIMANQCRMAKFYTTDVFNDICIVRLDIPDTMPIVPFAMLYNEDCKHFICISNKCTDQQYNFAVLYYMTVYMYEENFTNGVYPILLVEEVANHIEPYICLEDLDKAMALDSLFKGVVSAFINNKLGYNVKLHKLSKDKRKKLLVSLNLPKHIFKSEPYISNYLDLYETINFLNQHTHIVGGNSFASFDVAIDFTDTIDTTEVHEEVPVTEVDVLQLTSYIGRLLATNTKEDVLDILQERLYDMVSQQKILLVSDAITEHKWRSKHLDIFNEDTSVLNTEVEDATTQSEDGVTADKSETVSNETEPTAEPIKRRRGRPKKV